MMDADGATMGVDVAGMDVADEAELSGSNEAEATMNKNTIIN